MANIGDLFWMFHGDDSQLQKDAASMGGKAGTTAASSFQKTFGVSLKSAAAGVTGAVLGGAFAVAIKGAGELNTAEQKLAADTGLTGQAAKDADEALGNMYRNNLQGFDEIESVMAGVHNDLGLTGKAADDTAQAFLNLGTATGTDAAGEVKNFDDILDAWNLTADKSQGIMDQLVASHQKYGGSIDDNEQALAKLAPQLQALNANEDEGIGLLNLFAASGLDAASAASGLNVAVKNLKPGQTLDDLIKQISSIEDPTLRAQAAVQIFGAKAGVNLANVLKPGIGGLSDFEITAEDAAGATDKAAAEVNSSFGNQFTLILKNAGGALAQFGSNFGPLLLVANAFGPKFLGAIGSALGGLAGIIGPKLASSLAGAVPAAAAAGTAEGTAMGTAAAAAEVSTETAGVVAGQAEVGAAGAGAAGAAGGVLGTALGAAAALAIPAAIVAGGAGIALAFKAIFLDPGLQKQTQDIGTSIGQQLVTGTQAELEQSKAALEKGIADINALPLGGFLYGDQLKSLQGQLDKVNAAITGSVGDTQESTGKILDDTVAMAATTGAEVPAAAAKAIKDGAPAVQVAATDVVTTFGTSLKGVVSAMGKTGSDGMAALAQGITDARQKPQDAFSAMQDGLKHQETATQEAAKLAGELTSTALSQGLKSKDPAVRAQALAAKQEIIDRLNELHTESGPLGKAAMDELNKGLKSKDPEIRAAAQTAKAAALAPLNALKVPAATAGANAGTAFANAVVADTKKILAQVLADIKKNPQKYADPYGHGHAVGGKVPAGEVSWVGEHGPELNVQATNGYILNHQDAMHVAGEALAGAGGQGGMQINFTLPATPDRPTVGDIQRGIVQLSRVGYIPMPARG